MYVHKVPCLLEIQNDTLVSGELIYFIKSRKTIIQSIILTSIFSLQHSYSWVQAGGCPYVCASWMIHNFSIMVFWLLNDTYFLYVEGYGVFSVYQSQTRYLNFVHLCYNEISIPTTKVQRKVFSLQVWSQTRKPKV